MKIYTLVLASLISWAASIANAGDYVTPEGITVLTEKQIMTQIIGNTYMWGIKTAEFFEPSTGGKKEGRIKGKHRRTGLFGGNWKVAGPLMCWEYDDPKWAAYNNCFTTALDGDTVILYTIRGILHSDIAGTITLVSGNPNGL